MKIVLAITELEIRVNDISNQVCFFSQYDAHQMNMDKILKQDIDLPDMHCERLPSVIYQENIKSMIFSQSYLNFYSFLKKYH
jgi:hypothetical protein